MTPSTTISWPLCLLVGLCALAVPRGPAPAAEGVWNAWSVVLAEAERNRPAVGARVDADGEQVPGTRLELRDDATRLAVGVGLAGELELTDGLLVFAATDTGLLTWRTDGGLDTDAFARDAAETGLARAFGVEVFGQHDALWSIVLGKQRLRVARGLLVDAPALGGDVAVAGERFGLRVGTWWTGRALAPEGWPLVRGQVEWRPDVFTEVRLFMTSTRFDGARGRRLVEPAVRNGALRFIDTLVERWLGDVPADAQVLSGQTVRRLIECSDFAATISPWWTGIEVQSVLDGHTLTATALLGGGRGRIELAIDPECAAFADFVDRVVPPRTFELASAGVEGRWRARLAPFAYAGLYGMAVTGHEPQGGLQRLETYGAMTAPAPLVSRPALLLDGGLLAELSDRPAVAYGYDGRGLLTVGPTVLWVPHDTVEVDVVWLPAWSATERADAGRFYGHEVDGRLRWAPLDQLTVVVEASALWPGAFFPAGGPWWRAGATIEGALP